MALLGASWETKADREDSLRNTLGSMAIEGFYLNSALLALWNRWVQGELTFEELGALVLDDVYANRPEARLP